MTVKELIQFLGNFQKDTHVYIQGYEFGLHDLEANQVVPEYVALNVNEGEAYGGPHDYGSVSNRLGLVLKRPES